MRRRNPHAALRGFFAAQILFIPRKRRHKGARPLVDHDFATGRHLHDDFVERNPSDGNRRCGLDDRVVAHVSEVKKERGTMRLIGIVLNALSLGFTLAYGISGMR
jgi:hypothetical protein